MQRGGQRRHAGTKQAAGDEGTSVVGSSPRRRCSQALGHRAQACRTARCRGEGGTAYSQPLERVLVKGRQRACSRAEA